MNEQDKLEYILRTMRRVVERCTTRGAVRLMRASAADVAFAADTSEGHVRAWCATR